MLVSVIIVNFNGGEYLFQTVKSLIGFIDRNEHEIIIVDNNSSDGSIEKIGSEYPFIKIIKNDTNVGFGAANNIGVNSSSGKYYFFLNNDTIIKDNVISLLVQHLESNDKIGAIGPKLYNLDGTFQLSFGKYPGIVGEFDTKYNRFKSKCFNLGRSEESKLRYQEVDWLTGAALLVRANVFHSVKGFDGSFFMYFEDSDLCYRIKSSGYKIIFYPLTSLVHIGGSSVGQIQNIINYEYRRSQILYYKKHNSQISQWALKFYLILKYFARLVLPKAKKAEILKILKLVITSMWHF
jgi:GT2 family glycosyltransferase